MRVYSSDNQIALEPHGQNVWLTEALIIESNSTLESKGSLWRLNRESFDPIETTERQILYLVTPQKADDTSGYRPTATDTCIDLASEIAGGMHQAYGTVAIDDPAIEGDDVAHPEVGDSYKIEPVERNERAWICHAATVIAVSGTARLTFENAAGSGEHGWFFMLYDVKNQLESFHAKNKGYWGGSPCKTTVHRGGFDATEGGVNNLGVMDDGLSEVGNLSGGSRRSVPSSVHTSEVSLEDTELPAQPMGVRVAGLAEGMHHDTNGSTALATPVGRNSGRPSRLDRAREAFTVEHTVQERDLDTSSTRRANGTKCCILM